MLRIYLKMAWHHLMMYSFTNVLGLSVSIAVRQPKDTLKHNGN